MEKCNAGHDQQVSEHGSLLFAAFEVGAEGP